MKNKIQDILDSNFTRGDNAEALKELCDLFASSRFKIRLETESGTWFMTDEELKKWETDGSIEKGDKSYATVLLREY